MSRIVGVLTAGGDTPGLNAALRGLGKSAHGEFSLQLIGFYDGFHGLLQDRTSYFGRINTFRHFNRRRHNSRY